MDMVKEPTCESEFEVQAHLWTELRKLGFNIRGEVVIKLGEIKRVSSRKCRLDLAHFVDGVLAGIIEVKASAIRHRNEGGWDATRQGKRYHAFGVPVKIVYGMSDADRLIASAREGRLWE